MRNAGSGTRAAADATQPHSVVTLQFPSIQWGIMADSREKALQDYRKKLLEHKEVDGRLKECKTQVNFGVCNVAEIYLVCFSMIHVTG